jgi:group I intron endonuclease
MIDYRENAKWTVYIHIVPKAVSGYDWDKYYVGITSQEVKKRWKHGCGYQENAHFWRAIQKYTWENMEHEIIASNLTEQEAKSFEIKLIALLNSNNYLYGYNITSGGEGSSGLKRYGADNPFYGKKHTEETKRKMSENHADFRGTNSYNAQSFYCFTMDRKFVKKYDYGMAAIEDGFSKEIYTATKKHRPSQGYIWAKDCDVYFSGESYELLSTYQIAPVQHEKKSITYLFDIDGNFIQRFLSQTECAKYIGSSQSAVRYSVINGWKILKKYYAKNQEDVIERDGSFFIA